MLEKEFNQTTPFGVCELFAFGKKKKLWERLGTTTAAAAAAKMKRRNITTIS